MKILINFLFNIILFFTLVSCSSKKTVKAESPKPAEFTYAMPAHAVGLKIENIGNVTIKGSMPDKTVVRIAKKAFSKSKSDAEALLDKFKIMPKKTEDLISVIPEYPEISEGEKISSDINVLVPLNQNIPFAIALKNGDLKVYSVKGEIKAVVPDKGNIEIRTVNAFVDVKLDEGSIYAGNKIRGGKIKVKKGNIHLKQRLKDPDKDLIVKAENGDVTIEILHGIKNVIEFHSPKIVNKTGLKIKNNKWGKEGKSLKIYAPEGKIIVLSELF